jgi:hypothetical protein
MLLKARLRRGGVRLPAVLVVCLLLLPSHASGQEQQRPCRILCAPEFKVEPTVTITNVFGAPRVLNPDGITTREPRDPEFEVILSLDLSTRVSWLGFTIEAIVLPFDTEATPELELESNFIWLPVERTRGWVASHVDVVDKFSSAERPTDRRAYTHKLNLELDTSVALLKRLPEDRWLRGLELEVSLDYVATGLPRRGDRVDGVQFLDNASPWSLSFVFVLPVAPS